MTVRFADGSAVRAVFFGAAPAGGQHTYVPEGIDGRVMSALDGVDPAGSFLSRDFVEAHPMPVRFLFRTHVKVGESIH